MCQPPLPLLGQGWNLDEGVAPPPEGMFLDMPPAGITTPVLWPPFPMNTGPCCGMTEWGRCWTWGIFAGLSSEPECKDTDVHLDGGSRPNEGRVEYYSEGMWGNVCDDLWDRNNALVQLGLPTDSKRSWA